MPWEAQRAHYDRKREWLDGIKDVPCADCGNTFPPECMDFDHKIGTEKKFTIGNALKSISVERLLLEIAKCDLVCANCHRIRTKKNATRSEFRK